MTDMQKPEPAIDDKFRKNLENLEEWAKREGIDPKADFARSMTELEKNGPAPEIELPPQKVTQETAHMLAEYLGEPMRLHTHRWKDDSESASFASGTLIRVETTSANTLVIALLPSKKSCVTTELTARLDHDSLFRWNDTKKDWCHIEYRYVYNNDH
ncbi:hypothetical protein [Amycolatopsis pithecellobii]|uniref:Uncharacterized protein n=1 Tax=Amycolatopsis pithecellobii TaxID=664692 RepID=A0A6N7Z7P1_9PSEU|nr:hypothetical protein [Amycolatopsis pithecellobii]MTD57160.1 hypothetical protein [Amycolatopsis pithecellobii]